MIFQISEDYLLDIPVMLCQWKQRHFVVVYEIKKKRWGSGKSGADDAVEIASLSYRTHHKDGYLIKVADPAHGLVTYTKEEFLKGWLSTKKGEEDRKNFKISYYNRKALDILFLTVPL